MTALKPGLIPCALVVGDTIPEAMYKAWKTCAEMGIRVANVKDAGNAPPAYDMSLWVVVDEPFKEPRIFTPGFIGDVIDMESYRLNVVFGIWDEFVGHGWDYTYHYRLEKQIEPILARILDTWLKKGRITSRDFQFVTWIWEIDTVIDDPPCLQIVHCRLLPTEEENKYLLNLTIVFRSRDLGNAFWMNAYALTDLQRHLAARISKMLGEYGIEVGVGRYSDFSISNHLYGQPGDKHNLQHTLKLLQAHPWTRFAKISSVIMPNEVLKATRHLLAAQLEYSRMMKAQGKEIKRGTPKWLLEKAGLDWRTHEYPKEWDL